MDIEQLINVPKTKEQKTQHVGVLMLQTLLQQMHSRHRIFVKSVYLFIKYFDQKICFETIKTFKKVVC